jgi:aminoglycoside 6-adenylyltransferase
MLEWRVECDHEWSLNTGNLGKGLKAHLPADIWSGLESTFTGADPESNWEALFEMIALFGRVANEVGGLLGYAYPEDLVLHPLCELAALRRPTHASVRC